MNAVEKAIVAIFALPVLALFIGFSPLILIACLIGLALTRDRSREIRILRNAQLRLKRKEEEQDDLALAKEVFDAYKTLDIPPDPKLFGPHAEEQLELILKTHKTPDIPAAEPPPIPAHYHN